MDTAHGERTTGSFTRRWLDQLLAHRAPDPILTECERVRREKNISSRQIGDALGVSKSTVSSWLSGRRRPLLDNVRALCRYLGLTIPAPVPADSTDPGCGLHSDDIGDSCD